MTVVAIMAAVFAFGSCKQRDSFKMQNDSLSVQIDSIESVKDSLKTAADSLAHALDEATKAPGNPSCLGVDENDNPIALLTITAYPYSFYSISDWNSTNTAARLRGELGVLADHELDEAEFKALGNRIRRWGHTQALRDEPCNFWVRVESNGIDADQLWNKWRWMRLYFGGSVNSFN